MAIGLTGDPVPFSTRSGATVRRNSQRFSAAQAFSQIGEIEIVEKGQAHRDEAAHMDRDRPLLDRLRRRYGSWTASEPSVAMRRSNSQGMQSGSPGRAAADLRGSCVCVCARQASRPTATRRMSPSPTRTFWLSSAALEFCGGYRLLRFDKRRAAQSGNVEQHAAAADAVARRHDAVAPRAGGAHIGCRKAVIHLAVMEDVAERVDVARSEPVIGDADEVERDFHARNARRTGIVAAHHDVMQRRRRIFRSGMNRKIPRAADRAPRLHELARPRPYRPATGSSACRVRRPCPSGPSSTPGRTVSACRLWS